MEAAAGSSPGRSHWVYQEIVPMVSKKLGRHLPTKLDTKIERTVRKQFDALLSALHKSDIQTGLNLA